VGRSLLIRLPTPDHATRAPSQVNRLGKKRPGHLGLDMVVPAQAHSAFINKIRS